MTGFKRASFVLAFVTPLLTLLPRVAAQGTNATCLPQFNWMDNSRQQSPCLMAAYLNAPCLSNPGDAYVFSLAPDFHYRTPYVDVATPCECSSVFFSMLAACATCQNRTVLPWSTWETNCSTTYVSVYPEPIPEGTSIPAWAYLDVVHADTFNVSAAQALGDTGAPESSAPANAPTSATSLASSHAPAGVTQTGTPGNSGRVGRSSKHTNTGGIVGGVIGGVILLAAIIGAIAFFVIRSRRSRTSPSAQFRNAPGSMDPFQERQDYAQTPMTAAPLMGGSPMMVTPATAVAPSMMATSPPLSPKIYDPNDPSTFPAAVPDNSLSHTSYYPQSGYTQATGGYSGAPEI